MVCNKLPLLYFNSHITPDHLSKVKSIPYLNQLPKFRVFMTYGHLQNMKATSALMGHLNDGEFTHKQATRTPGHL